MLLSDQDWEEIELGVLSTDAPVHDVHDLEGGAHGDQVDTQGDQGDADDDSSVPCLVMNILTEQSIPENSGSQTQVFMFEHF